ncbi:hypothetical protein [Methylobacterium sp. sgz302541]|uniref:hypothetical protein n=1 Tax=unclassified Methylobacterium TaxID=2615210 RepID=UPI003D34A083
MPVPLMLPVAEAAVFTAGCLVIHAQRKRANTVTVLLAGLAAVLVVLLGMACLPESYIVQQEQSAIEDIRTGNALD